MIGTEDLVPDHVNVKGDHVPGHVIETDNGLTRENVTMTAPGGDPVQSLQISPTREGAPPPLIVTDHHRRGCRGHLTREITPEIGLVPDPVKREGLVPTHKLNTFLSLVLLVLNYLYSPFSFCIQ